MKNKQVLRVLLYATGLVILAFGLVLNTKTGLGTSPLVSIGYCLAQFLPLSFANATFIIYVLFVVIEIIIHLIRNQKAQVLKDLLQLPFSLIFTRFMGLFDGLIPLLTEESGALWGSVWMRIILLLAAVVFIGTGACLSVRMRLIPNPGDGVVLTISDFTKKKLGTVKIIFDVANVIIACVISLIAKGTVLGVGIGTVIAMLGVGRVMNKMADFLSPVLQKTQVGLE